MKENLTPRVNLIKVVFIEEAGAIPLMQDDRPQHHTAIGALIAGCGSYPSQPKSS